MTTVKKIFPLCILGLFVRLVLMPFTLHSDLWAVSFSEYLFSFKGVVNIYEYLAALPTISPIVQNYGPSFFTYPPLAYFTFGFFGLLLKQFFNYDFFNNLAQNLSVVLNDSRLYWHLFLTKFPYLFFDFGTLLLLIGLFQEEKKKKLVAILWLFNPLSFYTSYMIGQFDIIPVFFTVLALYLVRQKKLNWAAFSLGIGGAYKMFPLFFLPFLAFAENSWVEKIKRFLIGFSPYLISILFFVGSPVFRQTVLFSNQSQKALFAKINVSGAEYLSLFVVLYVFLLSLCFFKKLDLWKWFLLIMLLFFSVTHYHPQWFLWIMPFLIIFWVEYRSFKIFPVILFVGWFSIMVFFEPSLSVSLFAPLDRSLVDIRPLSEMINQFYDVFQFKSLVRSVFAGISLVLFIRLLKRDDTV